MDAEASKPLELAVFARDAVMVRALPSHGSVALGRDAEGDVRIDDPSVSRRHAVLHLGPPLRIEDLGATNGTYVPDTRVPAKPGETRPQRQLSKQAVEIRLGEPVTLGSVTIVVRRGVAEGRDPAGGPGSRAGRAPAWLGPAMRALHEKASAAANGSFNVLILGETGVGKEVLAGAVHALSRRAKRPFLPLNCAALPESLVESELFGHKKGSFSGAYEDRAGLFESAKGGTVFLDEIGELPRAIQAKLLRVVEQKEVFRVGEPTNPRKIDVRIVSATNRDLDAEIAKGAFREDLHYRLSTIVLHVPPLRDRVSEIEHLAEIFIAGASRQLERSQAPGVEVILPLLERYAWPGNVRELRNAMEHAVTFCSGDVLLPEHLPSKVASPAAPSVAGDPLSEMKAKVNAIERQRIAYALERCKGNQGQAAELLGISRRNLVTKLGKYDLRPPKKP